MSVRMALQTLLIALACVGSGTLECGGRALTDQELHGEMFYARMCSVCHGARGEGYAADRAPAVGNPHFLAVVGNKYLQNAIGNGRSGTTMSAWSGWRGGPLRYDDVAAVVAYLRTFERYPPAKLDDTPSAGDASRGQQVFAARCASCHGDKGKGGPFVAIGSPDLLRDATNGMLRATIRDGRPGTPMPAFGGELGAAGIDDVVAALRDWQGRAPPAPPPVAAKMPPLPLGQVPLNPKGPEPVGFKPQPGTTPADVVHRELARGARMAILDARAPSDYLGMHIAGAVSVPFYDPDPYVSQLPRDAWLVCYCSCPHAESGQLARRLGQKGFTKVTILDEGLGVWHAKKYPTSTGLGE